MTWTTNDELDLNYKLHLYDDNLEIDLDLVVDLIEKLQEKCTCLEEELSVYINKEKYQR